MNHFLRQKCNLKRFIQKKASFFQANAQIGIELVDKQEISMRTASLMALTYWYVSNVFVFVREEETCVRISI